ncbi:hypothetical protein ASQ43_00205 [Parasaccharibacter apium]|uniref:Uncharacterized protein n=1 Tax=Parasaccharibacter apium TaxID=1510841 RepID=A0ABX4ZQ27_9PROT|nr:hypothetical protein ASO19_06510 [Parasaccharibacter apium]POS65068.1 hypothetical protein ASQ42_00085 [Parasaccharibacter apium]POS66130.1 hypothetical protein ASQ43_00205 [Parasaccharibacter apium]
MSHDLPDPVDGGLMLMQQQIIRLDIQASQPGPSIAKYLPCQTFGESRRRGPKGKLYEAILLPDINIHDVTVIIAVESMIIVRKQRQNAPETLDGICEIIRLCKIHVRPEGPEFLIGQHESLEEIIPLIPAIRACKNSPATPPAIGLLHDKDGLCSVKNWREKRIIGQRYQQGNQQEKTHGTSFRFRQENTIMQTICRDEHPIMTGRNASLLILTIY